MIVKLLPRIEILHESYRQTLTWLFSSYIERMAIVQFYTNWLHTPVLYRRDFA